MPGHCVGGEVAAMFVRPGIWMSCDDTQNRFGHPPVRVRDHMDISVIEINLVEPITGLRLVPSEGRGALIGIIDSGFDLTHPSFLDARGKTRIVAAWDQVNLSGSGGAPPLAF